MLKAKHVYHGDIKPEPNTIFVFGSNPEGRHGAGSARVAMMHFGAVYGKGEGLQGNSYAIPTIDLRKRGLRNISEVDIFNSCYKMYVTANMLKSYTFKVAYRSKADEATLCGYTGKELFLIFLAAYGKFCADYNTTLDNIQFSEEWSNIEL